MDALEVLEQTSACPVENLGITQIIFELFGEHYFDCGLARGRFLAQ
jgi:hypothetical protein